MGCSPGSGGTWRMEATPKALGVVAVSRWIPGCKVATYTLIRGLSPLRTGTNIRQRLITGRIYIFVFKTKRSRIIAVKFTPATGYQRLDPSPNVKTHYHLPPRCCTFPPVHELGMFVVLCGLIECQFTVSFLDDVSYSSVLVYGPARLGTCYSLSFMAI